MALNFDLNDLLAFRAVAELQNFRKAAESINLSQPAFSRRIEKLEDALGVRLLDRTTRRVTLTAVGRDFARKVNDLLDDLDATLLGVRGVSATRMGEVRIACVPSAVCHFLSQVIRRYHEVYPRIRVRILDADANEVLEAVARGQVDFGLNFIGGQEPDIDFQPLLDECFVAACRRDHPLARERSVTWGDLRRYDFISISQSSGNRVLLDQALASLSERPRSLFEAQHVTTALGLVEAGLGVAAVPAMAMPAVDHPLLVSVALTDPVVRRTMGVIRRQGRSLSPAAQQLHAFLMELQARPQGRGSLAAGAGGQTVSRARQAR